MELALPGLLESLHLGHLNINAECGAVNYYQAGDDNQDGGDYKDGDDIDGDGA